MSNTQLKSVGEMCDEIKSLKAEKAVLQAEITELVVGDDAFERGWETCKSDMLDEIDQAVKSKDEEIKKLKTFREEVVEALKCDDDMTDESLIHIIADIEEEADWVRRTEMEEEIVELKTSLQTTTSYHTDNNELLKEEIKSLKDENLKKGWVPLKDYEKIGEKLQDRSEQISKLKEEVKSLSELPASPKVIQAMDKALKEREDYENKIKYYQFQLYTLDANGKCQFTKDEVDNFTEDQKLRVYLYEEIGYEEEEEVVEEEEFILQEIVVNDEDKFEVVKSDIQLKKKKKEKKEKKKKEKKTKK